MKKGYTFIEIMVTLLIIGIVAMYLIPVLGDMFAEQRYIAGFNKSFSVLNQALYEYASEKQDGDPDVLTANGLATVLENYLITKKTINADSKDDDGCSITPTKWIYTTDGYKYGIADGGKILADINGDKKPDRCMKVNGIDPKTKKIKIDGLPGDRFEFIIDEDNTENLLPGNSTAKYILFGENS